MKTCKKTGIVRLLALMVSALPVLSASAQLANSGLEINNVKARIWSAGDLFTRFEGPGFEVPAGSGRHTIFASNLWVSGFDSGKNLYVTSQTLRKKGTDFWAGPLDVVSGIPADSSVWGAKIWNVSGADIKKHIQNWNKTGYSAPDDITTWPGNGTGTFAPVLAPFVDWNGNMTYEPSKGEVPFIRGDQAIYFISNDNWTHGQSGGNSLGVEVQGMVYGFSSQEDDALNNTVFVKYNIFNRSGRDYDSVYFGIWTDFELGNGTDDFVGTDVKRNMYLVYNGRDEDRDTLVSGNQVKGYGINPPAQGVVLLNQPLSHSIAYNSSPFLVNGAPSAPEEYNHLLHGRWKNGQPLTYGNTGIDGVEPSKYIFSFDTDPDFQGRNWDEKNANSLPGERTMLGSTGPYSLKSSGVFTLEVAYVYARGNNGPLGSVTELQKSVDHIRDLYENGMITAVKPAKNTEIAGILLFPNPMVNSSEIVLENFPGENFNLSLMDVSGKTVLEVKNIEGNKYVIDRGNLENGLYFLTVQSELSNVRTKLIINK